MSHDVIVQALAGVLTVFIHFTSQYYVIWPWYFEQYAQSNSNNTIKENGRAWSSYNQHYVSPQEQKIATSLFVIFSVVFNILVAFIYYYYMKAWLTDPGRVPKRKIDDENDDDDDEEPLGRYCRKCRVYKPPRCHHCSSCNRCILKMDHHCPWIGNCVGFYNHGHFIRFLIFASIASTALFWILIWRVLDIPTSYVLWNRNSKQYWNSSISIGQLAFLFINLIATAVVSLSVGLLTIVQIFNAAVGKTSIERSEIERMEKAIQVGDLPADTQYPFELPSILDNLRVVFGRNLLLFLCPMAPVGNGLSYSTIEGCSQEWPLKEITREYLIEEYDEIEDEESENYENATNGVQSEEDFKQTLRFKYRRGSEGYIIPGNLMQRARDELELKLANDNNNNKQRRSV